MSIAYQYTADGCYVGEIEDYGLLPNNATYVKPELKEGFTIKWDGSNWIQVEDKVESESVPLENPILTEQDIKNSEIKQRLLEIDAQSIRPLRAMMQGVDTVEDQKILNKLMDEAESLRHELI